MRKTFTMALACGMAMLATACTTYVKPEARAGTVRVAMASQVKACSKVGHTTVTVPYKLGFIHRSAASVAKDLLTMGKNSAVDMQADTIVAASHPRDGNQTFDVYRCRQ